MTVVCQAVLLIALSSMLLYGQQESTGKHLQAEHDMRAVASDSVEKLDINSASSEELTALKGIGEIYAAMIVRERPYRAKTDLIKRKVIPAAIYEQIKDDISAKQTAEK